MNVAVVDYGLGNIYSVMAALHAVGSAAVLDTDGSMISKCDTALVPGVAAFGASMRNLHDSGQAYALREHFDAGKKLVGLCLGAQMFMDGSQESPADPGLGFVAGNVVRLDEQKCTVPNQGWLRVADSETAQHQAFPAMCGGDYFYFSHSYRMDIGQGVSALGATFSGQEPIVAVYHFENVLGVQFHPERSGIRGLEFLSAALAS